MEITFKAADLSHLEALSGMVREFYEYDETPLDERAALSALRQILTDSALGRVYLLLAGGEVAGYVILTLGFSLEHQGRDAFVDELFVRESYRSRGLGKSCLRFVEGVCRELGVRALHLEVGRENTGAQALYRRAGFIDHDRRLMTKRIEPVSGEKP